MARIHVLPERIINIIAAGEVVERPASVVKELLENALDAGATQISVTLANGGKDLISVLDNGCGMDEADAKLAVHRHATSKLEDEQGLEGIQSLGFRGEALASIAAVSRFELISCAEERVGGTRVTMAGGREEAVGRAAFPRGSKVTVQELFFNTPARRKFLRSAATEFQHIQTAFTQLALAHPEVHFRLTHGRREVSVLTACENLRERVFQLFGEAFAEGMLWVEGREGRVGFAGLVSSPSFSRASRRWQHLFINRRPIRNVGVNHGIYQAYRTLLMKERHPAYVLNLSLEPGEVDVNVHPAKTEVRLRNAQLVHTVVADRLHKALLDASRRKAFADGAEARSVGGDPAAWPAAARPAQRGGLQDSRQAELTLAGGRPAGAVRDGVAASDAGEGFPAVAPAASAPPEMQQAGAPGVSRAGAPEVGPSAAASASSSLVANPLDADGFHFQPLSGRVVPPGRLEGEVLLGEAFTLVGQLHATYLLVQRAEYLVIVDQHAAHERILFEQYRREFYERRLVSETFLIPLTLELSAQNGLLLEQYLPQWNKMGFEIEPFGKSTYQVRQIPALLSGRNVERLILDVLDDLALFGKSGRLEEVINEILERVACHSAVRAGMHLSREEMEGLVAQLTGLDINLYCPHGRPVWVEFPLRELEKRFKRIV
jgi:DNA mismatch repair protein MutL